MQAFHFQEPYYRVNKHCFKNVHEHAYQHVSPLIKRHSAFRIVCIVHLTTVRIPGRNFRERVDSSGNCMCLLSTGAACPLWESRLPASAAGGRFRYETLRGRLGVLGCGSSRPLLLSPPRWSFDSDSEKGGSKKALLACVLVAQS